MMVDAKLGLISWYIHIFFKNQKNFGFARAVNAEFYQLVSFDLIMGESSWYLIEF